MGSYVVLLLAVAALAVWAARSSSRIERLEEKLRQSRLDLAQAKERLGNLASEVKTLRETFAKFEAVPPVQPTPSVVAEAPYVEPVPAVPIPRPEEKPAETAAVTPPRPEVKTPREEPREASPERIPAPPRIPTPTPSRPPRTIIPAKPKFDWEALIGVKLFSWIAGIALVLAAVFFLKYSVDHGWLGPPIRMAIGLVTGAALLVLCEWKAARRYAVTANALDAAGIAILFSTFFAAHALWDLIGVIATFAAMAMVTAVAVLLSIRRDSMFIALLGLVGGFAAPILLSTGEDRPIGLFSYLVLLDAGLAWVAYRKRWPYLTALSALFTTIYQWGWVMKFLQAGNIPLALGIFLVFPVLSFSGHLFGEKRLSGDS